MPGVLAVQPFAAFENTGTLALRDAGAVVFDAQFIAGRRAREADAHFAQAQPIGVFQQVAEHFQQRALFHMHLAVLRQVQRGLHLFVAIHLVQRVAQAFDHGPQHHMVAHQTALAQAGPLQLIADLLAHAFDLRLQHPCLLDILGALGDVLAYALQDRQRGFQAMRQVVQRVAVTNPLFALAAQQAVERVGQAQQFAGVFFAEAVAHTGFHLIEFLAQAAQGPQPPGQAHPQQPEQHRQCCAKAQIKLAAQAVDGFLIAAQRLHGNDTECGIAPAEQPDLDVIDEILIAIDFLDLGELAALPVVLRAVVDVLAFGRQRAPDHLPLAVIDVTQQTATGQIELFARQYRRHQQMTIFDARGRNHGGDIGSQALLDRSAQRQAERPLQSRQHQQHEDHRQRGGAQHQAQAKRTNHVQRSLNR